MNDKPSFVDMMHCVYVHVGEYVKRRCVEHITLCCTYLLRFPSVLDTFVYVCNTKKFVLTALD